MLAQVKADDDLKGIAVVALTKSKSEEDVLKGCDLAANCYVTKPIDLEAPHTSTQWQEYIFPGDLPGAGNVRERGVDEPSAGEGAEAAEPKKAAVMRHRRPVRKIHPYRETLNR